MIRIISLNIMIAALSGCAVREANLKIYERQRPANSLERKAILEHMRDTYFDPYSIRDAEISNSAPSMGVDSSITYMICIKANAKNRFGAYAGRKTSLFYFDQSGNLTNTVDSSFGFCENKELQYLQFPEAENIGEKEVDRKPRQ